MKSQIKLLLLAGVASLSVCTVANANISTSIESVCLTASNQQTPAELKQVAATQGNSTLLAQHFNVMACNGKLMLENTKLERADSLLPKSQDNQLVGLPN